MESRLAAELPLTPVAVLKASAIAVALRPKSEETSAAPWRRSDSVPRVICERSGKSFQ